MLQVRVAPVPKLNPHRVPVPRREPGERVHSFDEIELGYSFAEARAEAERCIQCPAQPCVQACPGGNSIPTLIAAIRDGRLSEGIQALRRTSAFPAICSRLCDQAQQCEGACAIGKRGDAVAIGRLERFLADWDQVNRPRASRNGYWTSRRVAVVGGGPCGMAAAGLLAERGHDVHVIDALSDIGGVLAWGIPLFRLPDRVLQAEVDRLFDLGVVFHGSQRFGPTLTLDGLFERGYHAVLLATGAPHAMGLNVPGSDLPGVVDATRFLSMAKLAGQHRVGRRVVVIGGGNTAMDVAGTAVRLGAQQVTVLYRRTRDLLPARREEVHAAEEEGVRFQFQAAPLAFLPDAHGHLAAVRCARTTPGAPGPDGRATAVVVPGDELDVATDQAVLAVGYSADPSLRVALHGIALDPRGYVQVDPATGRTSRAGVWAGGDVVTGPATVAAAMAAGLRAARDIDQCLKEGLGLIAPLPLPVSYT
jgi:glutamate synthase (NADPH/NADH) small chain